MKSEKYIQRSSGMKAEWYGWFRSHPMYKRLKIPVYHKIDGPAFIQQNQDGSIIELYFLFGKHINKEDFYTPGFIDAFILENT
jgi:hypothetical protein